VLLLGFETVEVGNDVGSTDDVPLLGVGNGTVDVATDELFRDAGLVLATVSTEDGLPVPVGQIVDDTFHVG